MKLPFALVLLATAVVAGVSVFTRADAPAARIHLPTYPIHLGSGLPNESISGSFEITNPGTAPLEFEITPSCACSNVTPQSGAVEPHRSVMVSLSVTLPNAFDSPRDVVLQIASSDPYRPSAAVSVFADCPLPFSVLPAALNFGTLSTGETLPTKQVVLGPLALEEGESAPAAAPGFQWRLDRSTFDVSEQRTQDGELTLNITPRRYDEAILLTDNLRVSDGEHEIVVPLSARYAPAILIAPRRIPLPAKQAADEPLVYRLIAFSPAGKDLGDLLRVDAPDGVEVVELNEPTARSHRKQLQLTVSGEDSLPNEPAAISLSFTNLDVSAEVTLLPARQLTD